jgi:polyhydroxyalkanoate synthase
MAEGSFLEDVRKLWDDETDSVVRLFRKAAATAGRPVRALASGGPRVLKLLETMAKEYVRDLEALGTKSFFVDVKPLAGAWKQVLTGAEDEEARKLVGRFVAALRTKLRHGWEVYADPETTPVGRTPRTLVARPGGRFELYRYAAPEGKTFAIRKPVLLVYSVINKPYILDLTPGFSFVEHLLDQGLDVYLIEWGKIVAGDKSATVDAYVEEGIGGALAHIRGTTGAKAVPLFGHCIGGNLALMHAALHPGDVERVVTLTTPVTAGEGGVVALWTDRLILPVDEIIDACGLMPAKLIRYTFIALKPYYELVKAKMWLEMLGNEQALRMFHVVDRWGNDNVDVAGEFFRKFIHEVYHDDRFRKGLTTLGGRTVDLKAITCPLMNLAATRDWIVPLRSAQVLNELVGSTDNRFVPIEGAHVTIMIDPRARPLWTTMSDFLGGKAGAESARA